MVSASTYEDRDRWITVLTDATRKLATKTADSYNKPLPMLNHATSGPSVHPAATETATSTVDTQLNQVIQEQLREITAQFQALHAEMLRVAGENSVLAEELRQERNQRQRLEVELAVQRGKVQGFEAMLAVPAESRYVLCSGVNDGTAPLEASERKEILLSLDAERKAQEELASLSKDLLSMLDKQLLHQEQPRRNSGVLP